MGVGWTIHLERPHCGMIITPVPAGSANYKLQPSVSPNVIRSTPHVKEEEGISANVKRQTTVHPCTKRCSLVHIRRPPW